MDASIFAATGMFLILCTACTMIPGGDETPTPQPTAYWTPAPTPTPTQTMQPTPTPGPTMAPTSTPAPTRTPTPAPTPQPTSSYAKDYIPNGDFETGTYEHWTVSDEGFGSAPSDLDAANANRMYLDTPYMFYHGRYAASSYLPVRDAGARGTLTSEPFTISKQYLEFLVTGMQNAQIYVELWVDGAAVKRLEPDNPTTNFQRITWDVSAWQGKTGYILISDGSSTRPRGYIEVDDFYLTNTPAGTPV